MTKYWKASPPGEFAQFERLNGYYVDAGCDYTPEIFASWFVNSNSGDQERFLEEAAKQVEKWDTPDEFQWAFLTLSRDAKAFLERIREHAQDKEEG